MKGIWERLTANRYREATTVATFFLLVALAATWPLPTAPGDLSVSTRANSDVFLNQYLIFWGAHALTEDIGNLYHTNMFHPSSYAFAYADMLLTDSLLLLPVIVVFEDPGLAYNVLLWLSIVIGGTGMYALCRHLGIARVAGLTAGLLFTLNPAHFVRYRQPQFFNDGFLPWFIFALLAWFGTCGLRNRTRPSTMQQSLLVAAGAALLFCLHTQTGSHNAIFGLVVGTAIVAYHAADFLWKPVTRTPDARRFGAGLAIMGLIGLVILLPLFYPYFAVSQFLEGTRITPAGLENGSADLIDLLSAPSRFYLWLNEATGWPSAFLEAENSPIRYAFPGAVLLVLAALALAPAGQARWTRRAVAAILDMILTAAGIAVFSSAAFGWRRLSMMTGAVPSILIFAIIAMVVAVIRARLLPHIPFLWVSSTRRVWHDRDLRFWVLAVTTLFLAALGPSFGVYELVRAIPGANLIRVPSRFILPAMMGLSVLAGWGATRLLNRGRRGQLLLAGLVVFFVVESTFVPIPAVAYPYPPDPVAQWLGEQPGDFAVLEVPFIGRKTDPTRQMVQSVHHWKKLLVGYSGSAPPDYEERMRRLRATFPTDVALDELGELGVRFVVVREARIAPAARQAIVDQTRLQFVQEFETGTVWELMR